MNDDLVADLKQFITTTVAQQITPVIERIDHLEQKMDDGFGRLEQKMDDGFGRLEQKMDDGFGRLEQKMDDGFGGVGEAIETIHKLMDQDKAEVGSRLTVMEQKHT